MKEITSAFPKTTFHCKGNLSHPLFPSIVNGSTRESTSPTNTLHHEGMQKCIAKNNIALWMKANAY
jgi:hypothetical protein